MMFHAFSDYLDIFTKKPTFLSVSDTPHYVTHGLVKRIVRIKLNGV